MTCLPERMGCHLLRDAIVSACPHQRHEEAGAIIPILLSLGTGWLPWGLSYYFLNIMLRKHSRGERETHIFFSPFSVFKAVSSWEGGPLCCWAFSCLWQRERGLEQGEQVAAGRGHPAARHSSLNVLQPC